MGWWILSRSWQNLTPRKKPPKTCRVTLFFFFFSSLFHSLSTLYSVLALIFLFQTSFSPPSSNSHFPANSCYDPIRCSAILHSRGPRSLSRTLVSLPAPPPPNAEQWRTILHQTEIAFPPQTLIIIFVVCLQWLWEEEEEVASLWFPPSSPRSSHLRTTPRPLPSGATRPPTLNSKNKVPSQPCNSSCWHRSEGLYVAPCSVTVAV